MLRGSAFAPATISNFFTIDHGKGFSEGDLHETGATGGGYVLSEGVVTRATARRGVGPTVLRITVNGDSSYRARTTETAVKLLLADAGESSWRIELDQSVAVPIGSGFGASAASALSAVMAVASALSVEMKAEEVAYAAHRADILCKTGLGTVSVIYKHGGAGVIVKPGAPGISRVRRVPAAKDIRIVTASLAPYKKSRLLSAPEMASRVNELGLEAMRIADGPTLENLMKAGEFFATELGLASPRLRRLSGVAKMTGALGASQNMVGEALHAVVHERAARTVADGLRSAEPAAKIGIYSLSSGPATVLPAASVP